MKRAFGSTLALSAVTGLLLVGTSASFAAPLPASYFGSPVSTGETDKVVSVTPQTRKVTVHDGDNVDFVVQQPDGTSRHFGWHFERFARDDDLETAVSLRDLAPSDITIADPVEVYVYRNDVFDY